MTTRHILLAAIIAFSVCAPTARAEGPGYVVIVNPKNPAKSIARHKLEQIFLKKEAAWSDGPRAQPVDQLGKAPVRAEFSRGALGRSARAVKNYWHQQVFTGRAVPPPELGGDADVVSFVPANRDVIGYVVEGTALGRAKVLAVTN